MTNKYHNITQQLLESSQIPISFEGNYWIFTSALFCTMIATLVSITQIYAHVHEMIKIPDGWRSPINVYRSQVIFAYLTVLFGATPDAVYLWTYGEVLPATTNVILNVDRIFDSLTLAPFLAFTWLQVRCGGVLKFQLLRQPIPLDIKPALKAIKYYAFCSAIALGMSVLVAISK